MLEFNCRFGDPETQPLVMQLDEDLLPLLHAAARGELPQRPLRLRAGVTVGVVMAATGARVFQAGTKALAGRLVTAGGRVLTVCAHGATVALAREAAYRACALIRFEGAQYRRDIGARALA